MRQYPYHTVKAFMDTIRPLVEAEATARVATEERCEDLTAENAALGLEARRLRDKVEMLQEQTASRDKPPPPPYATWSEHDDDQREMLREELSGRRHRMGW